MTLDDVPALAVVALCLRELRNVRLGLELALAQLRADLRAVLALLVPIPHGSILQGEGGGAQPGGGVNPPVVGDGDGSDDEGQGVERAA